MVDRTRADGDALKVSGGGGSSSLVAGRGERRNRRTKRNQAESLWSTRQLEGLAGERAGRVSRGKADRARRPGLGSLFSLSLLVM